MMLLIFMLLLFNNQKELFIDKSDDYYVSLAKKYSEERGININLEGWKVYLVGFNDSDEFIKNRCTNEKGLLMPNCPTRLEKYKAKFPNHPFILINFVFEAINVKESSNMILMGVIKVYEFYREPNYIYYIDKTNDDLFRIEMINKF